MRPRFFNFVPSGLYCYSVGPIDAVISFRRATFDYISACSVLATRVMEWREANRTLGIEQFQSRNARRAHKSVTRNVCPTQQ
jgi:hypothetical protein